MAIFLEEGIDVSNNTSTRDPNCNAECAAKNTAQAFEGACNIL